MKIVGLTGSIATGKSVVAKMFAELGVKIVDSDAIAKDIVRNGKPAYNEILEHFGSDVLAPDGEIDREKLGKIIFEDETKRQILNEITHPRVFEIMRTEINIYASQGVAVAMCDVPLLIESGAQNWLKPIVLVYVDRETQLARLMQRDGCSRERAISRISSQMQIDEKRKFADYIIDNSGSIEDTRRQVEKIYETLIA